MQRTCCEREQRLRLRLRGSCRRHGRRGGDGSGLRLRRGTAGGGGTRGGGDRFAELVAELVGDLLLLETCRQGLVLALANVFGEVLNKLDERTLLHEMTRDV